MPQELTAEQLVAGAAERDAEMLGQLYDQCAPNLFGLISRIVTGRDAAREVLREVFIGLWKDARRIQMGGKGVMVWLMLDARARAVDRQRQDDGLPPAAYAGLKLLLRSASWLPGPEEVSRVAARRSLLNKIVRRLPSSQNRLVELAIFKGQTEDEMAEHFQQPLSRIESELRAGLRFLRHRLRAVLGTWTVNI
jgi:RNA polymerase sigma-70 factor, ECF subfamily